MPIKNHMRDRVSLLKRSGHRFDEIQSIVRPDFIMSGDTSIPIEEGDVFERTLPSGVVERYTVLEAGYYEGVGSIPAGYKSAVRKETRIEPQVPPTQIVYNLIGPNARVNIQSFDASDNLVQIQPSELFEKLRAAIDEIPDPSVVAKLAEKLDELDHSKGTPEFTVRYREFMALAANHVTVLAPFLPALSQMLS